MTDECISTTVEYITSATLKMNNSSHQQQQQDVYDGAVDDDDDTVGSRGIGLCNSFDRPDALGMGCEESSNNSSAVHSTNGKPISVSEIKCMVARMPTERNAMEYNMNHKKRGLAIIFNHEFFDIPSLENRKGTNIDCEKLKKTFKSLDFEVSIYKDCKLREVFEHIDKAAAQDHSEHDCIAVAILTHGEQGYLYAKDVMYKLDTIWHYFSARDCPTLAGKPKLFFIQACRGDRLDPGIKLQKTETDGETSSDMSYRIPIHADFLIAYSTIPGFYSWRNTSNGSWFIQSLVEELNINGKKYDLLTLLTFVNRRVAMDYESCVPSRPIMDQQKQIPCITSMLTRILRFTDKPKQN
ncbi:caspase-1-like isoform X2 [Lucilia sericata]|nr:caspase-1-like isoform X2 [Lucilia sericata]XP_037822476.1 caspase-1-like isoform X2 [Lucilia sericata]XP_037822477.1 caspase-1-like isoform X2 [Lucilia sericata]XP_037822478.1 caspase-1-like isoform X2 [Lucilia sericata]XP_037822479.1 caspase-1-like isoform X2 [Lucilia sericata]XP_037822480.1 caspase-1-like isoform X2 [Lucilia sericata]XP_037822481.1 caspase-1-like isoform X2 [Lucilia sericata]XP_037822482.1 caspase-1-like isoform X2 [Lucilia sericata]XP_037822484.1 caspase-1-like isofo